MKIKKKVRKKRKLRKKDPVAHATCSGCGEHGPIWFSDVEEGDDGEEVVVWWCKKCATETWFPWFKSAVRRARRKRKENKKRAALAARRMRGK